MERDEALALFENLTGAAPHVAEHVLDAHGCVGGGCWPVWGAGAAAAAAAALPAAAMPLLFQQCVLASHNAAALHPEPPSSLLPVIRWDVNSAVEWFLESGGVGHGFGAEAAQAAPASPPGALTGDKGSASRPSGSRTPLSPLLGVPRYMRAELSWHCRWGLDGCEPDCEPPLKVCRRERSSGVVLCLRLASTTC